MFLAKQDPIVKNIVSLSIILFLSTKLHAICSLIRTSRSPLNTSSNGYLPIFFLGLSQITLKRGYYGCYAQEPSEPL